MPDPIIIANAQSTRLSTALERAENDDYRLAGEIRPLLRLNLLASEIEGRLTVEELADVLQENYHVRSGSATERAEAFIEHIATIAGSDRSINSDSEADALVNYIKSEEAFILAGGAVIYNNIDDARQVWVHLNCQDTSAQELADNVLPYSPHSYLSDVKVSWGIAAPDGSGDSILFTYTRVFGRNYPSIVRLHHSSSGGIEDHSWELVNLDDSETRTLLETQRANIQAALLDAEEIEEDDDAEDIQDDVQDVINVFINNRGRVNVASGSHIFNPTTKDYVEFQHLDVQFDGAASNAQVYSAVLSNALYMCGDRRYRQDHDIPIWTYEPHSYNPNSTSIPSSVDIDRDEDVEPRH